MSIYFFKKKGKRKREWEAHQLLMCSYIDDKVKIHLENVYKDLDTAEQHRVQSVNSIKDS